MAKTFKFWCASEPRVDRDDALEVEFVHAANDAMFSELVESAAEQAAEAGLYTSDDRTRLTVYVLDETGKEWEVDVIVDFNPTFTGGIKDPDKHTPITAEQAADLIDTQED